MKILDPQIPQQAKPCELAVQQLRRLCPIQKRLATYIFISCIIIQYCFFADCYFAIMDLHASNLSEDGAQSMVRSGKLSASIHFNKPTGTALQLVVMAVAPTCVEIDHNLIITESKSS